jgi:hypothetical protein
MKFRDTDEGTWLFSVSFSVSSFHPTVEGLLVGVCSSSVVTFQASSRINA